MDTPHDPTGVGRVRPHDDPRQRALLLWPGLDRPKLARTGGQPGRVARLVGRRTALSHETILRMLGCDPETCDGAQERSAAVEGVRPMEGRVAGPPREEPGPGPASQRLVRAVTAASQFGRAS